MEGVKSSPHKLENDVTGELGGGRGLNKFENQA